MMRQLAATIAVALMAAAPAWADASGSARALDGVTLEVAGQRVALFGVEGPPAQQSCREWVQQGQREYRCGALARAFLQSLVASHPVYCVSETAAGEAAATCFADGRDLSLALVEAGWAVAAQGGRYVHAEQNARGARRGLWAGASADPDQWRRARTGAR